MKREAVVNEFTRDDSRAVFLTHAPQCNEDLWVFGMFPHRLRRSTSVLRFNTAPCCSYMITPLHPPTSLWTEHFYKSDAVKKKKSTQRAQTHILAEDKIALRCSMQWISISAKDFAGSAALRFVPPEPLVINYLKVFPKHSLLIATSSSKPAASTKGPIKSLFLDALSPPPISESTRNLGNFRSSDSRWSAKCLRLRKSFAT